MNIEKVVDSLLNDVKSLKPYSQNGTEIPMPNVKRLKQLVGICRSIIFPGYFERDSTWHGCEKYTTGLYVEQIYVLLQHEIYAALAVENTNASKEELESKSVEIIDGFVNGLPELRRMLNLDVKAIYDGDPAAESFGEIIFAYPGIRAIINYRIAHLLYKLGTPLLPRVITEMAHSETGIDIHPYATIGERFAIDHGTGVVIGATAIIGNNVKIYQGVTLGAKSFPKDAEGNLLRNEPRHPIIGDNVVIYAQATILGRITIGSGSVIGGNVWVTNDVAPNMKIMQTAAKKQE